MKTALPTIGIRPTIDGRRLGVRESLEDQTMNMAKAAAALIEANIRHASGEPVQCVIADTCIGGPAEAAACADKFKANNVGVSLAVTPCWCYGSETFDMDPFTPKAIWGFNGTERPGAVYLAAALAGLALRRHSGAVVGKKFQCAFQSVIVQRGQVGEQGRTAGTQCIRQGGGQQVQILPEKSIPHGSAGRCGAYW